MAVFLLILVPSKQNFVFEQESHRTQATRAEATSPSIDFVCSGSSHVEFVGGCRAAACCAGLIIHRVQKLENRPCLPSDDVFPELSDSVWRMQVVSSV